MRKQIIIGTQPAEISGPFSKSSAPWGTVLPSMNRTIYYINWKTAQRQFCYCLINFDNQPNRFIVDQVWPLIEASTLKELIVKLYKMTLQVQ
jgi:hypothetical protein